MLGRDSIRLSVAFGALGHAGQVPEENRIPDNNLYCAHVGSGGAVRGGNVAIEKLLTSFASSQK